MKTKRAIASRMLTKEERLTHTPVFSSKAWKQKRRVSLDKESARWGGKNQAPVAVEVITPEVTETHHVDDQGAIS